MPDEDIKYRKNISLGDSVEISLQKERNKTVSGIVKNILTNAEFHTHGIWVELESGDVGRIQRLLGSNPTDNSESIYDDQRESMFYEKFSKLQKNRKPIQTLIEIKKGETGYSYENLFYPYMKDAKNVIIKDSFIRIEYQVKNLVAFCSFLANLPQEITVQLITNFENESGKREQSRKFDQ